MLYPVLLSVPLFIHFRSISFCVLKNVLILTKCSTCYHCITFYVFKMKRFFELDLTSSFLNILITLF